MTVTNFEMSIISLIFAFITLLQPLKPSSNSLKLLPVILEIELSGYQRIGGFFIVNMDKVKDLTGQKFGKLTVLKRAENDKYGHTKWLCKCDCGNEKVINSSSLKTGRSNSCGCLYYTYEIDNYYFSKQNDCSNKYYVLGLIYTDGNLPDCNNSVSITSIDLDLLEDIKKELKYTGIIRPIKNQNTHILSFSSRQIRKDLENFGLTPNKTFTLKFPDIPKEYLPDFVRGLWDGDGTVTLCTRRGAKRLKSAFVCANKDFISAVMKLLPTKNKNTYIQYKNGYDNPLYFISLGSFDSLRLRDFMYQHTDSICLKRKKDRFYDYVPTKWMIKMHNYNG